VAPNSTFITPLLVAPILFIDPPHKVGCCHGGQALLSRDTQPGFLAEPGIERFLGAGPFE
jgi:hypothetical protein